MLQRLHIASAFIYGIVAAIAYAIPMTYFIASAQYEKTWWLFVGNFLFLLVIVIYMLAFSRRKHDNPNTSLFLTAGHITTIIGVVVSCIVAFIVLSIYAPAILTGGEAEHVLEGSHTTTEGGKTDGLVFFVYMDAIIGNFSAGSAVAFFLAYTTLRNQTHENVVTKVKVDTNR